MFISYSVLLVVPFARGAIFTYALHQAFVPFRKPARIMCIGSNRRRLVRRISAGPDAKRQHGHRLNRNPSDSPQAAGFAQGAWQGISQLIRVAPHACAMARTPLGVAIVCGEFSE